MTQSEKNTNLSYFKTKQELETEATTIANKATQGFWQATYLYFLARFLVIHYEVNFFELPIQVWNEYRNALDHYFRSITEKESSVASSHIKKMEGHLQRAVLDICKLICHRTEDRFGEVLKSENKSVLRMVDNGDFYTELLSKFEVAKSAFIDAKALDMKLGDGANNDRDIVGKYLNAFYCYIEADLFLQNSRDKITKSEVIYNATQHQTSRHHIRDSIIAKILWYGTGSLLVFFAGKYYDKLQNWFQSVVSWFFD